MSPLGKHHVADALLIVEVGNIFILNPLARQLLDGTGFVRVGRHIMVGDDNNPVLVPDVTSSLQHRLDPARPAGIVDHRKIDLAHDNLANRHRRLSGGASDQFAGRVSRARVSIGKTSIKCLKAISF